MARQWPTRRPFLSADEAVQRGLRWWRRDKERNAQHWYVTFCLLLAAAQDHLTAISLRTSHNLNWAVTAYYYAMMHSVRLLCFLRLGDFPTSHANLHCLCTDATRPIALNWLPSFATPWFESAPQVVSIRAGDVISLICPCANTTSALRALGALRNDSTYEALLIAHERHHDYVSERFQRLALHAETAASNSLETAFASYLSALEGDLWGEWPSATVKAASNSYVQGRLVGHLAHKFRAVPDCNSLLRAWRQRLTVSIPARPDLTEFQESISMHVFQGKMSLMDNFDQRLERLQRALRGEAFHD